MRKFLLAISFLLFTRLCFALPTVTIATPNSFSPNTTIYSSQVNSNFNEIQNKFNVHNHTDITQTGVITSGNWNGTLIGITYGGTGLTTAGGVSNRVMLTTNGTTFSTEQVGLTNMVTGTLPVANGGTGQVTAQAAIDGLLPSQGGNSGKFLTTNGTNGSWGTPATTGFSNVIFSWFGSDIGTTNIVGLKGGTSLTPNIGAYTIDYSFFGVFGSTYQTILTGKFTKIAGISTITIMAKLWDDDAGAGHETILSADVGGQSNTVTENPASATPAWVPTSTIDVSGLTNNTVYDITIQLKNTNGSHSGYCSAIELIGS